MLKSSLTLLAALLLFGCASADKPADQQTADPETRVVAYLDKTVTPGKPVLVTQLYSEVFTTEEDQMAVKRLYDSLFQLPAFVAKTYTGSGHIPTQEEITQHFSFKVPGTTQVLMRILESDPRVPRFFERNASGEITAVNVDAIRNAERFGAPLQDQK